MNNIIISYDLHTPGQNYGTITERIKSLGSWAQVNLSVFYIKTNLTAAEVRDRVWPVMDANDKLFIVDTTNDASAWQNLSEEVSNFLLTNWSRSGRSILLGG